MKGPPRKAIADRFWARVTKTPDCWLWTGSRNAHGYGMLSRGGHQGAMVSAHRVSWELAHGKSIPDGLCVCHVCDNPQCVRPDHLFLGTQTDNIRDCVAKGRKAPMPLSRGAHNGHARLSTDSVREIRRRYDTGSVTQIALAREFGVPQAHISRIILRQAWREV